MRISILSLAALLIACQASSPSSEGAAENERPPEILPALPDIHGGAVDPHANPHGDPHAGLANDPHAGLANDPHAGLANDPHAGLANPHASAGAPAGPAQAGGLTWEAPAPLVRQTPRSSMRAAQYTVEGDDRAELGVFYFGADQGGSVEANITRWLGQLAQPDGSSTEAKAKRGTKQVGKVKVSTVEAQGAYSGGMGMPGVPPPQPIADAMMLAAIAEGPEGAVFFKLVGPRDAVERARSAFNAMIESLRPVAP